MQQHIKLVSLKFLIIMDHCYSFYLFVCVLPIFQLKGSWCWRRWMGSWSMSVRKAPLSLSPTLSMAI